MKGIKLCDETVDDKTLVWLRAIDEVRERNLMVDVARESAEGALLRELARPTVIFDYILGR